MLQLRLSNALLFGGQPCEMAGGDRSCSGGAAAAKELPFGSGPAKQGQERAASVYDLRAVLQPSALSIADDLQ